MRYAKGEITKREFQDMKKDLEEQIYQKLSSEKPTKRKTTRKKKK